MKENDIVSQILKSLSYFENIDVRHIDPNLYGKKKESFILEQDKINWIAEDYLKAQVNDFSPDILVCCAGGLSPEIATFPFLKLKKIKTIGIALSDPDDFEPRSKSFSYLFDNFYTNSLYSISLYKEIGVNPILLPFAVDVNYHAILGVKREYDVIVVGAARPERLKLIKKLKQNKISVKCFGSNWYLLNPLMPFIFSVLPKAISAQFILFYNLYNTVNGKEQVIALNRGKIYISFALTEAGYTNVKVGLFEAAASGCCVLVEDFPEVRNYFKPNEEIVLYKDENHAVSLIKELLKNQNMIKQISKNAIKKVVLEHTWVSRWKNIFKNLE